MSRCDGVDGNGILDIAVALQSSVKGGCERARGSESAERCDLCNSEKMHSERARLHKRPAAQLPPASRPGCTLQKRGSAFQMPTRKEIHIGPKEGRLRRTRAQGRLGERMWRLHTRRRGCFHLSPAVWIKTPKHFAVFAVHRREHIQFTMGCSVFNIILGEGIVN